MPPHQVLAANQGGDSAANRRKHLPVLKRNPTIKARFPSEPAWLNLYRLQIRYSEREAREHPRGLPMPRPQRTVLVIRNGPAPGTTVRRANPQHAPDKAKKPRSAIIPDMAKAPVTHNHEFPAAVPDLIAEPDLLALAGMLRPRFPANPPELRIAQRVHAYTRAPGAGRRNTRVKGLVDMAPIARTSQVKGPQRSSALR